MESDREKEVEPLSPFPLFPSHHPHISQCGARSNPGPLITIKLHLLLKHIHFII